jgi:hypothetical protein
MAPHSWTRTLFARKARPISTCARTRPRACPLRRNTGAGTLGNGCRDSPLEKGPWARLDPALTVPLGLALWDQARRDLAKIEVGVMGPKGRPATEDTRNRALAPSP